MALSASTRLGSYEVIAQIGAGGMGEVYQAHDTKLGRDRASKALLRLNFSRFQSLLGWERLR